MRYEIVAKGFGNGRARALAARIIARGSGVPFPVALAMTDGPPVTLRRDVDEKEIAPLLGAYRKAGIDAEAVEAAPSERKSVFTAPPPDFPVVSGRAADGSGAEPVGCRGTSHSRRRLWFISAPLIALLCCGIAFLVQPGHAPCEWFRRGADVFSDSAAALTDSSAMDVWPDRFRNKENGAHPIRASEYIDSAERHAPDVEAAIRFYLMAIAFNKHNVNAWYGLIGAYRAAGRAEDERRTREAMRLLLGEAVFSIEKIIRPFGVLTEYRRTGDGGIYVEYRTRAPTRRESLLGEAYLLSRALRTMCNCRTMTVVAATGPSSGLMARCGARDFYESIERFEAASRILFFEKPEKSGVVPFPSLRRPKKTTAVAK